MPVISIGVDLVEIKRIEKMIRRFGDKFTSRIFTDLEIEYCSEKFDCESYAARFAVKEAVFKAAGCGLRDGMKWKDVELVNDVQGRPNVRLHGKTAEMLGGYRIHVSVSHSRDNAVAMIVVED